VADDLVWGDDEDEDDGKPESSGRGRQKWLMVGGPIVAVLIIAIVVVATNTTDGSTHNAAIPTSVQSHDSSPAPQNIVTRDSAKNFFSSIDPLLAWQPGPPYTGSEDGQMSLTVELSGSTANVIEMNVNQAIGDSGFEANESATFIDTVEEYAGDACVPWITQQLQTTLAQGTQLEQQSATCGSVVMTFSATGDPDNFATLDLSPPVNGARVSNASIATTTTTTFACPTGSAAAGPVSLTTSADGTTTATVTVTNNATAAIVLGGVDFPETVDGVTQSENVAPSTGSIGPSGNFLMTLAPGQSTDLSGLVDPYQGFGSMPTAGPASVSWDWPTGSPADLQYCASGSG
jgi:hypothetical protein